MKKFVATILALIYLTASTGAVVNFHYCMGKLKSWDLSSKQKSACGVCGMEKAGHKGCCKDEQKVFKVEKDHKASEFSFQFSKLTGAAIPLPYHELPVIYAASITVKNPAAHAPPGAQQIPVYLLYCNFRI